MASQASGADSRPINRSPACRCRKPDSAVSADGRAVADPSALAGRSSVAVKCLRLALDLGPGLRPGRVVLADVAARVAAVPGRRGPVGDLIRVGGVGGVVGL